jgi:formylglycine-generating enzyme required for sulfatase activity
MRRFITLLAAVVFLQAFAQRSQADIRVALVIGNGAYQNVPRLPNPPNDAADVAAALRRSGFDTSLAVDLDRAGMDEATIKFAKAARTADVALFYYAGHALQFGGFNYLAPVDAKLTDESDLRRLIRVDQIVSDLQQAKNLRILILDSCRDNPLADQLRRSIGTTRALPLQVGLAKIEAPQGMIVAYATQSGRQATDGDGRNSPYTAAFLGHIEEQEEIGTIFRRVSSDVYEKTKHEQLPELSLSLIGEFYLRGRPELKVPLDPCTRGVATVSLSSRQACPLSAAEERSLKPKDSFKECDTCPEMVVVPSGSFMMGSPSDEKDRGGDEGPQHRVTISHQFAVGKFAVSFEEWRACTADGRCDPKSSGGWVRRPVVDVSWEEVQDYLAWLSRKSGKSYRLLSESEREYVARAGTTTPFWTGTTISPQQANYSRGYDPDARTAPVDRFQPNPWGLYQVHGNVWEWTEDCYSFFYEGAPSDGSAWTSGGPDCRGRALRGGSFTDHLRQLRAASRSVELADHHNSRTGFRVARTLAPP